MTEPNSVRETPPNSTVSPISIGRVVVPFNIRRFMPQKAAEMGELSPDDTESIQPLADVMQGVAVPREVYDCIAEAAARQGIPVSQYIVDTVYRASLYDTTGYDMD